MDYISKIVKVDIKQKLCQSGQPQLVRTLYGMIELLVDHGILHAMVVSSSSTGNDFNSENVEDVKDKLLQHGKQLDEYIITNISPLITAMLFVYSDTTGQQIGDMIQPGAAETVRGLLT